MEGNVIDRRPSTAGQTQPTKSQTYSNIFVTPPVDHETSGSAKAKMQIKDRHDVPKIQLGQVTPRTRTTTETNFADTEVEELIAMLRETENLEEQGDILQYLVDTQGLDFNTGNLPLNGICLDMHE